MDVEKIVFNELQRLEVPQAELSDEGQGVVMDYIENYASVPRTVFYEHLPKDWSWEWKVQHGTFAGTLSKRIQSFLFKQWSKKLSDEVVTKIGNIATEHTLEAREFLFDFDRSLDWSAGDFGDTGSCFWTQKPWSMPMLSYFGGLSLRLYQQRTPLDQPAGVGRCLIVPWSSKSGYVKTADFPTKTDALMVFNGYGAFAKQYGKAGSGQRYGNMQVLDYARLLALYLGVSYERVILTVNGSDSSPLYINNGGYCVMVGPTEIVSPWKPGGKIGSKLYKNLKIVWPKDEIEQFMARCSNCENNVSMVERSIPGYRHGKRGSDGHIYCDKCYGEVFVHCLACGVEMHNRNASVISTTVIGARGRIYLCNEHYKTHAFECPQCGDMNYVGDRMAYHTSNTPSHKTPTRRVCCRNCYVNRLSIVTCSGCDRDYPVQELRVMNESRDNLDNYNRFTIGQCPQCVYKAKAKLEGAAPKDDEEQLPFLLLPVEAIVLGPRKARDDTDERMKIMLKKSRSMNTFSTASGYTTGNVVPEPDLYPTIARIVENGIGELAPRLARNRAPLPSFVALNYPPYDGDEHLLLNRGQYYSDLFNAAAQEIPSHENLLAMEIDVRSQARFLMDHSWRSIQNPFVMRWEHEEPYSHYPILRALLQARLTMYHSPLVIREVSVAERGNVYVSFDEPQEVPLTQHQLAHFDIVADAIFRGNWMPTTAPWHETRFVDNNLVGVARLGQPVLWTIHRCLHRALHNRGAHWLRVHDVELRAEHGQSILGFYFCPPDQPY